MPIQFLLCSLISLPHSITAQHYHHSVLQMCTHTMCTPYKVVRLFGVFFSIPGTALLLPKKSRSYTHYITARVWDWVVSAPIAETLTFCRLSISLPIIIGSPLVTFSLVFRWKPSDSPTGSSLVCLYFGGIVQLLAKMNPSCSRCNKTVYPTEKVNCLDKVRTDVSILQSFYNTDMTRMNNLFSPMLTVQLWHTDI